MKRAPSGALFLIGWRWPAMLLRRVIAIFSWPATCAWYACDLGVDHGRPPTTTQRRCPRPSLKFGTAPDALLPSCGRGFGQPIPTPRDRGHRRDPFGPFRCWRRFPDYAASLLRRHSSGRSRRHLGQSDRGEFGFGAYGPCAATGRGFLDGNGALDRRPRRFGHRSADLQLFEIARTSQSLRQFLLCFLLGWGRIFDDVREHPGLHQKRQTSAQKAQAQLDS